MAGVLLLISTMGWGAMELAKTSSTREGASRVGGGGRRIAILPTMAAAAMLYAGPYFVPAAAIRPAAAAFAVGMVVLVGGLALRGWSAPPSR